MRPEEIVEVLESHPWLPRPKYIYVLNAPVVFPQLKAIVFGLNPGFERDTIILASNATPETVVHECIHVARLGGFAAYTLAPRLRRFRERIPPLIRRPAKYEIRRISDKELRRYGLEAFVRADGFYLPTELEVIEMRRGDE